MGTISVAGRPLAQQGKSIAGHLYILYETDDGTKFIINAYVDTETGELYIQQNNGGFLFPYEGSFEQTQESNTDFVEIDLGDRDPDNAILLMEQYASQIDDLNLDYNRFFLNSNSTAASLLDLIGVDVDEVLPQPKNLGVVGFLAKSNIIEFDYSIQGTSGDDYMQGRDDSQTFHGFAGNDHLLGGDDTDYLYGGIDQDDLYGEKGDDWLYGEAGNDDLFGGKNKDHLYGGDGIDFLDGGAGNDELYGGSDNDRFIFVDDFGNDTIHDFELKTTNYTTVDFENVPGTDPNIENLMPSVYAGLNWNGFAVLDPDTFGYINTGYNHGTTSGDWVAYNGGGRNSSISGNDFDLESGYFTSAWRDLTVTVNAYDDGVFVGSQILLLNTSTPKLIQFDNNIFNSIDQVFFIPETTSLGYQFVLDDLNIGQESGEGDKLVMTDLKQVEIQNALNNAYLQDGNAVIPFTDGSITLIGLGVEDLSMDMFAV